MKKYCKDFEEELMSKNKKFIITTVINLNK